MIIKNNDIGSKIHQNGLINRDNIKVRDVIKMNIKIHMANELFFFVFLPLMLTEMPTFYNLISINYNISLALRYLDERIIQ